MAAKKENLAIHIGTGDLVFITEKLKSGRWWIVEFNGKMDGGCNPNELDILPYNNELNKKLYPDRIVWKDYLVTREIRDQIKRAIKQGE